MTFHDWRKRAGLTQIDVARNLGVSRQFVSRIERPGYRPGSVLMQRIISLTDGTVRPDDFWRDALEPSGKHGR